MPHLQPGDYVKVLIPKTPGTGEENAIASLRVFIMVITGAGCTTVSTFLSSFGI